MASYYQRNGIYWLAIVINGKQKAFSLKTRDKIQAVKRGQKLEAEYETVSVSQLLTLWLKRKQKLRPRTKADMKTTVKAFIEWFGDKPAGSLKKQKLYKYLEHLESKKYNPTSQSIFFRRLKSLFNWGWKNEYISNQPFKGFEIPAWKNRTSYLTVEEVKRVIKKAGALNPLHEQFLILLASTGARLGEFSTLRWDDVNIKKRCITFTGKTGARPFELTESIEACLDKIYDIQREHSEYIFSNKTGTWLGQYNYLSKLVKKYMTLAEVFKPFMGAHIFRHSFCTNKILQGENVFTIKELVGHRKIETTLNYIQVIPKMKKPANYWEN